ncbi:aspartate 1-decarboxylase [Leptospira kobayashii]|uniref:Aspartate 1-decarboxylase n=2 Tax=Leptospira TaxID=171 RepID=A0A4R9LQX5_9LEPT|nr:MULTISPECIES: aspartate 1-decarboxylase [Leptospira]TGN10211.1 aspartate 1-decarboxylase [Leptospira ilyithenensis]BDA79413.1 aspartate 1-decarboxylase [Leptospira kobayashii]
MMITVCKAKIHRAIVTEAELHYEGSLTVDQDLMDLAGMRPYEQVSVVNVNNGARFETYLIVGERGSGTICLNGAAARLGMKGDKVIIITYGQIDEKELSKDYKPQIVFVDENNHPKKA